MDAKKILSGICRSTKRVSSSLHQNIEIVFRQLPDVAEVRDRREERQRRLRHRRVDGAEQQVVLLRSEDVEHLDREE